MSRIDIRSLGKADEPQSGAYSGRLPTVAVVLQVSSAGRKALRVHHQAETTATATEAIQLTMTAAPITTHISGEPVSGQKGGGGHVAGGGIASMAAADAS